MEYAAETTVPKEGHYRVAVTARCTSSASSWAEPEYIDNGTIEQNLGGPGIGKFQPSFIYSSNDNTLLVTYVNHDSLNATSGERAVKSAADVWSDLCP